MNTTTFTAATAVFFPTPIAPEAAVAQYGFYCPLDLSFEEDSLAVDRACVRLTARTCYRLYVNGEMVMHGPARTAHGYCRVDEVDITDRLIDGVNHIAVEVVTFNNRWGGYNRYSNDYTIDRKSTRLNSSH